VADVFDTNKYANSTRADFLNWSVINTSSFDYAADSWGYTAGASLEWYQGRWTVSGGAFLLSDIPNDVNIDTRFSQFELVGEIEERHTILGQPGKARVTGYVNRGEMGQLKDAVNLAQATGQPVDIRAVRHYQGRPGASLNLEQQLRDGVGAFFRIGYRFHRRRSDGLRWPVGRRQVLEAARRHRRFGWRVQRGFERTTGLPCRRGTRYTHRRWPPTSSRNGTDRRNLL